MVVLGAQVVAVVVELQLLEVLQLLGKVLLAEVLLEAQTMGLVAVAVREPLVAVDQVALAVLEELVP
jgi:hypothetical protein